MKRLVACLLLVACDSSSDRAADPRTCERAEVSVVRGGQVWTEVDAFEGERRVRTVRAAIDAERASDHATDFNYDGARVVREDHDEGANGTIDWTASWTYEADDWTLFVSTWPTWSKRHERVLDDAGHVVSERVDDFTNGTWDLVAENTWVDGRLVERLETTFTIPPTKRITYDYDAAGREVLEEHDLGDDGTLDSLTTRAYDAVGKLRESAWRDPDGAWIEGTTITRDSAGRVSSYAWDSTLDGFERVDYSRDAAGNILTRELTYGDDASPTTRWTFTAGCRERDASD